MPGLCVTAGMCVLKPQAAHLGRMLYYSLVKPNGTLARANKIKETTSERPDPCALPREH